MRFELHFLATSGLALLLGAIIGFERQWRRHQAGLQTNALVAFGSSLFVAVALHFPAPDRVLAQIVSGIGFLGAGMILRDGIHVRGLNTAATLWCSAAIGTITGLGDWGTATEGTVLVVAGNIVLHYASARIDHQRVETGPAPPSTAP